MSSIPPPSLLDSSATFGEAIEADAVIPIHEFGKLDDFIDDIISVRQVSDRWE